jgi:hypothetical protein
LQSPYPGLVCIPVANQEEAWLSNFLLDSFDFIPSYSFPLRKNIFNFLPAGISIFLPPSARCLSDSTEGPHFGKNGCADFSVYALIQRQ